MNTAEKQMLELDAEIEAMEGRQTGKTSDGGGEEKVTLPTDSPSVQEQGSKPSVDDYFGITDENDQAEPPVGSKQDEIQQPPVVPDRTLVEEFAQLDHRYKTLRRTSDAYKFESRQQIAALQDEVVRLQGVNDSLSSELNKLRQDTMAESLPSFFTDEDRETFGPTIDNFQKTLRESVNAAVKPLQEELAQLKKEKRDSLRMSADTNRQVSYTSFRDSLRELVPDLDKMDRDPGFLAWLKQPSQFGGFPRIHYLRNAEKSGDVERVAQYFITYNSEVDYPNNLLAEHTTPVGDKGGGAAPNADPEGIPNHRKPPEERLYTQAQLDRFYEDDINGKFIGQEALRDELENQFELALRQGRVVRRIPK